MNKIDEIEKRLFDRVSVKFGFAYPETLARNLEKELKAFDVNRTGFLDFKGFFAAMTKFNFSAVQSEIEQLFNRYDEDGLGLIDMKAFSSCVCGFYTFGIFNTEGRRVIDKLISKLITIGTFLY